MTHRAKRTIMARKRVEEKKSLNLWKNKKESWFLDPTVIPNPGSLPLSEGRTLLPKINHRGNTEFGCHGKKVDMLKNLHFKWREHRACLSLRLNQEKRELFS